MRCPSHYLQLQYRRPRPYHVEIALIGFTRIHLGGSNFEQDKVAETGLWDFNRHQFLAWGKKLVVDSWVPTSRSRHRWASMAWCSRVVICYSVCRQNRNAQSTELLWCVFQSIVYFFYHLFMASAVSGNSAAIVWLRCCERLPSDDSSVCFVSILLGVVDLFSRSSCSVEKVPLNRQYL